MNDDDDERDSQQAITLSLLLLLLLQEPQRQRIPSNRQWSGQEVADNLLNCGSATRIHSQLQMQLNTFFQLRDWLVINTDLKSSLYISIKEKLLIFIFITSIGASNRATQERFNHGLRAILSYVTSYIFNNPYNKSL